MRLLHAGISDARARASRARAWDERRGAARSTVVEPVPLHRLPEHPEGGARCRAGAAMKPTFIGKSVQRLEDAPLVRGEGRFAARTSFPGELHMRVVRSSHAHGKIVAIEASQALAAPGCVAVWT